MAHPMGKIQAIYRYPVKGLSPEALPRAQLSVGETLPADRLYATENGPSGFEPATPAYLPKQRFLMLMRHERLAALRTAFDEATHTLTVTAENREAARGGLRADAGGAPVHPLRFRGNVYVAGWPAWHEFNLIDEQIAIGPTRLKVVRRIKRC